MANRCLSRLSVAAGDAIALFLQPYSPRPINSAITSGCLLCNTRRSIHTTVARKAIAEATASDAGVKPFDEIPGPKPLPIVGNIWRFLPYVGEYYGRDSRDLTLHMYEKYGPIVKLVGIPGKPALMYVFRPEDVEVVFRNEGQWPIRGGMATMSYYRNEMRKEYFQGVVGVLIQNGPKWLESRSRVNPAMMQPRTSMRYIPPISSVAQEFVDRMRAIKDQNDEMPPDFMNELFKWALESIAYVALDTRLGCLRENLPQDSEGQKMIDAVGDFFDCLFDLEMGLSIWKYYSTPSWKRFVRALDIFLEISTKYVDAAYERAQAQKQMDSSSKGEPSVLERLLERASPKEAALMAQEMIFGGVDTSSYTMASAIYCLSKNQDKQELLYQELKKFLPRKDDVIKEEFLEDMKYLRGCLKEVFRVASPFSGNARVTAKDTVIGNYKVPAGTFVIMPTLITYTSEEFFPLSKRFVPERWLKSRPTAETTGNKEDFDSTTTKKPPPFGLLPFGFGPRSCVGRRFAEMELYILLIKIFRNFRVEYNHGEIRYEHKVLSMPKDPLRFKISERKE
ncbi:probable cytochrome P450 49a1 [Ischnura elegans]|uniref:probable cytochrome P450 49a1 n=1 Tax=Ischnura elegans TaxID=197161 RepID=UPI001ED86C96|nr:probable cytochrome P450 49a1 [Ischnura elegans]